MTISPPVQLEQQLWYIERKKENRTSDGQFPFKPLNIGCIRNFLANLKMHKVTDTLIMQILI